MREASLGRSAPSAAILRRAFRQHVTRRQRRSDGTITVEGRRFELPTTYHALERVHVRYARWDLSTVDLVDPRTETHLAVLYPLDKRRNADGRRRVLPFGALPEPAPAPTTMAPALKKYMADYAATGLPPAYLAGPETQEENHE